MKISKSIWWGSMPWERDGGAVVNYYLLNMLHRLMPSHDFYGIPKFPLELDRNSLPFMEFMIPRYFTPKIGQDMETLNKHLYGDIPTYMSQNGIPLLVMFHIPHVFFPIAKFVRDMDGKTLVHQTIHWENDVLFNSEILNEVDKWVVPTKWGAEKLASIGGISDKKIKYIPHSVDINKFYSHQTAMRENMGLSKDKKVILVVGRCSLAKGIHNIIPIMRPIIDDYDATFIIRAGVHPLLRKSKEIGYMLNMMSSNHPKNIVWLPDWYPPSFLEELMASCDILLQPSGHEGFDVPLIEAMATKKAIAVTNIPNHYEIMGERNRLCGIFMDPTEVVDVVNDGKQEIKIPSSDVIEGSLRYLLENPDECLAMGEQGYKRVKQYYSLEKNAKSWLRVMDGMF